MPNPTPSFDALTHRHHEPDRLMADMQRGDLYEALRRLGIATAYAVRYGEALPVAEMVERIRTADVDPVADAVVTEGMARLMGSLRYARRGLRVAGKRSDPPAISAGNAGIQAPWMAHRRGVSTLTLPQHPPADMAGLAHNSRPPPGDGRQSSPEQAGQHHEATKVENTP